MAKKYTYLKIGNEEFNHLLDEIDDIWIPIGKQPYTDIKFKNGEAWITTAPVLVGFKYEIKRMTWNEFLQIYNFSRWKKRMKYRGEGFIEHYSKQDFLDNFGHKYDADKHIIFYFDIPIEIIDWDADFDFYVVYSWLIDEENVYQGLTNCFFNKEKAKELLKTWEEEEKE